MTFTPFIKRETCNIVNDTTFTPQIERERCIPLVSPPLPGVWILAEGIWDDSGEWIDADVWID